MNKFILVLRHEFLTTVTRRSFLILSFGVPLVLLVINLVVSGARGNRSDISPGDGEEEAEYKTQGYLDLSGIIQSLPEDIPAGLLLAYDSEADAEAAIENGLIQGYYVVPEDYISSGDLVYVRPDFTPLSSDAPHSMMNWALMVNLLDGDLQRAQQVWNPADLKITSIQTSPEGETVGEEDCSTPGYRCDSNVLVRMLPFGVVILFFIFLSSGSGLLLRSVTTEKENRLMEILLLSIKPRQMLAGKIVGLGIASLLQLVFWIGTFYVVIKTGGQTLNLPTEFSLPQNLLLWLILFFLFGYLIYASLMAAAGALVPSLKEISSASWVMLLPLLFGYFIAVTPFGLEAPHSPFIVALSIFPLTAPVVMVMRITIGGVPAWQLIASIGLSIISAIFIINASARLFRAQTLLSGESFQVRRFFKALLQLGT